MSHTPAPWKYYQRSCPDPDELHRFFVAQPDGNNHIIANTVKEYASIDDEANARLIAAAPELLDALENTVFFLDRVVDGTFDREDIRRQQEYIASITKKARGE